MGKKFLSLALLIGFTTTASLIARGSVADQPRFEREFSGGLNEILIENRSGATEAETWPGETVKVVASRRGGSDSLDSEILFENPQATTLKVTVRPSNRDRQISLKVFVPSKTRLLVKGSREPVTVKGQTNGLSVDTDSGNITVYLSQESNALLALRAPNGSINLKLPVIVSGLIDSTQLDGRIGQGGPGIILRSSEGNINLLPDKAAGTLAADAAQPSASYFYSAQFAAGKDEYKTVETVSKFSRARKEKAIDTEKDADAIRLRTRLVNLNVKVLDQFGRTVPNLTKENFEVFEDGERQEISHFEPVTAPVSLVLLMDLSGSIKSKLKELKKAAKNFVDTLRPEDRVAVAGFTRRFFVVVEFSNDKEGIKKLIDKFKGPGGGTAFYDSLWKALDLFDEIKETRKAVVVLTDGVDSSIDDPGEGSELEFEELVGRIEEEEVTIYPIYFDTEYQMVVKEHMNTHEEYVKARQQLQTIAERTGGELYKATRVEDLEGVYQKIASELFTLYSVAYLPKDVTDERRWRRVSVKVNREGVKAKTRQGYRTN
ncbi:MAG TPA: VWA domain-containing protein [Blastocatellia bacterium]|nr:VWA domain-containing protein [Blastocatellia bacterium]